MGILPCSGFTGFDAETRMTLVTDSIKECAGFIEGAVRAVERLSTEVSTRTS